MCCGVINIYKEKGFTSHDVVAIVRRQLGRVKTGHTGTLDPDAEGVLPICVGKATKIAEYIASDIKEYKAVLSLGRTTTTQDAGGETIAEADVTASKEQITEAALSFQGTYSQMPPMYSAIKVNGKKLYELARAGVSVERKSREITIYCLQVEKIEGNDVHMTVLCSKGTYIRTLCADIGDKLGCGGHMSYLLRTRTGPFSLNDSMTLEQFKQACADGRSKDCIKPVEDVLTGYKKVMVAEEKSKYLYNGNSIPVSYVTGFGEDGHDEVCASDTLLVYDFASKLIGIYQTDGTTISPVTMLF